ncbi:MAG: hypothetical protein ABI613_04755 [Gemmatimonadota bacterium]
MISVADLWMPILLSAVIVFFASSVLHMVLKYHRSDYRALPGEDAVLAALRSHNAGKGQYMFPYCSDMSLLKGDAMQKKFREGPVGMLTLRDPGVISMGPMLGAWFLYLIVVALLVGYVAGVVLPRGTEFMMVFRVVSATAWLAFAAAHVSQAIWQSKPWPSVIKEVIDGLVYALLTAGVFGWLWPR